MINKNNSYQLMPKRIDLQQQNYIETIIPRNIIQTHKTNLLHSHIHANILNMLDKNRDYNYIFITDDDAVDLIRNNFDEITLEAFHKLKVGAAQGDFKRYIALYVYGGTYLDLDASIEISLNQFIPVDKDFVFFYNILENVMIVQWIFMIKPKHFFMKMIIEEMVKRIHDGESNIFVATGPTLFTDIVYNYIGNTNVYDTVKKISKFDRQKFFIEKFGKDNSLFNGIFHDECKYDNWFLFNMNGYHQNMIYSGQEKYLPRDNIFNTITRNVALFDENITTNNISNKIISSQENEKQQIIPKNIIQTYKTRNFHPHIHANIMNMLDKNKDYNYIFITDDDAVHLIRNNFDETMLHAFQKLKVGAARGDFIRYIALYVYGGTYLDLDASIETSLSDFVPFDKDFIFFYNILRDVTIINWIFMIKPKHFFMKLVIDEMVKRINNDETNFFIATGPILLTDIIYNYIENRNIYDISKTLTKYERQSFFIDKFCMDCFHYNGIFYDEIKFDNFFRYNMVGYKKDMIYYDEPKYKVNDNIYIETKEQKNNSFPLESRRKNKKNLEEMLNELYDTNRHIFYNNLLQLDLIDKYENVISCLFEQLRRNSNNYFVQKQISLLEKSMTDITLTKNKLFEVSITKTSMNCDFVKLMVKYFAK